MSANARVSAHPLVKLGAGGVLCWVVFGMYRGATNRYRGDLALDNNFYGHSFAPHRSRNALPLQQENSFPPSVGPDGTAGTFYHGKHFLHPFSHHQSPYFPPSPTHCCCCCHHCVSVPCCACNVQSSNKHMHHDHVKKGITGGRDHSFPDLGEKNRHKESMSSDVNDHKTIE